MLIFTLRSGDFSFFSEFSFMRRICPHAVRVTYCVSVFIFCMRIEYTSDSISFDIIHIRSRKTFMKESVHINKMLVEFFFFATKYNSSDQNDRSFGTLTHIHVACQRIQPQRPLYNIYFTSIPFQPFIINNLWSYYIRFFFSFFFLYLEVEATDMERTGYTGINHTPTIFMCTHVLSN